MSCSGVLVGAILGLLTKNPLHIFFVASGPVTNIPPLSSRQDFDQRLVPVIVDDGDIADTIGGTVVDPGCDFDGIYLLARTRSHGAGSDRYGSIHDTLASQPHVHFQTQYGLAVRDLGRGHCPSRAGWFSGRNNNNNNDSANRTTTGRCVGHFGGARTAGAVLDDGRHDDFEFCELRLAQSLGIY